MRAGHTSKSAGMTSDANDQVGVAGFEPATPSSRTRCSATCLSAVKSARNLQRNLNDISVRSFILTGAPRSIKPSTNPKELDYQSLLSLPVVSIGGFT